MAIFTLALAGSARGPRISALAFAEASEKIAFSQLVPASATEKIAMTTSLAAGRAERHVGPSESQREDRDRVRSRSGTPCSKKPPPFWSCDRDLELALDSWAASGARIPAVELEVGNVTGPPRQRSANPAVDATQPS